MVLAQLCCLCPTEIQVSDLLPHLEWKREARGQHFLRSLSQRAALSHPPSVCKAGDSPPDKGRGGPLPPLPDNIQRLAACQATQHHHHQPTSPGSFSKGFGMSPSSDLAQSSAEAFSKAFTELFFLPYIAAGRPGVPCTEPPAAIRHLFQKGVLSSQILGEQDPTRLRPSSLWLSLHEPYANSKAHLSRSKHMIDSLNKINLHTFVNVL